MTTRGKTLARAACASLGEGHGITDLASAEPREIAALIADVTLEMRNLANRGNMKFLAYLLEMSFQEAFDISQGDEARKK